MMMDGVPSWSRHQNLQEDGMVQVLFMISLLADIPQLGATMILVMAPKLQEDGMVQVLFTISLLADVPQLGAMTILVTAPKFARGVG